MANCKVCGAQGAKFCMGCRRRYGGMMVVVTADQDQDDCLAAAAESYIATHPALTGWDLSPTWADASREQVTLTVPAWAARSSAAPRAPRKKRSAATPRKSKHLSKEAFKRRMRAGKLKAARARARGGR